MQFSVFVPTEEMPSMDAWQRSLQIADFDVQLGTELERYPEDAEYHNEDDVAVTAYGHYVQYTFYLADVDPAEPAPLNTARHVAVFLPGTSEQALLATAMVSACLAAATGGWLRNELSGEVIDGRGAVDYARWFLAQATTE